MAFSKALDEPLLAELYMYWSERRRGRVGPARGDIDPVDIPALLPHVALTEIVPAADGPGGSSSTRFRYRLAGTQVERYVGCPLAGRYMDEVARGSYLAFLVDLHDRLVAEKAPLYSENSFTIDGSTTLNAKRLMLPLSDDGDAVSMVLTGMVFSRSDVTRQITIVDAQDRFRTLAVDGGSPAARS